MSTLLHMYNTASTAPKHNAHASTRYPFCSYLYIDRIPRGHDHRTGLFFQNLLAHNRGGTVQLPRGMASTHDTASGYRAWLYISVCMCIVKHVVALDSNTSVATCPINGDFVTCPGAFSLPQWCDISSHVVLYPVRCIN